MSEEAPSQPRSPRNELGQVAAHEVTDERRARVRELAKVGTQEEVAGEMGFSVDTLQRHYSEEYASGNRKAVLAVKTKLLGQAMGGSVNAMFRFLQLAGAVKRAPLEVTGPGGGPIPTVDLKRLTREQLEQYGRLAAIAEGLDPDAIIVEHLGDQSR
jgi:hypothetical protein